jgi:hypothetical protein
MSPLAHNASNMEEEDFASLLFFFCTCLRRHCARQTCKMPAPLPKPSVIKGLEIDLESVCHEENIAWNINHIPCTQFEEVQQQLAHQHSFPTSWLKSFSAHRISAWNVWYLLGSMQVRLRALACFNCMYKIASQLQESVGARDSNSKFECACSHSQ